MKVSTNVILHVLGEWFSYYFLVISLFLTRQWGVFLKFILRFSVAIEKFGNTPVPAELNSIGLPITPPFNLRLNKPLDFSKLLAKVHRSPFTNFLFDVGVLVDPFDSSKTRLVFNYTPSIMHGMLVKYIN